MEYSHTEQTDLYNADEREKHKTTKPHDGYHEFIKRVLLKCAEKMPENPKLEILEVSLLTNPERDPNPRFKSTFPRDCRMRGMFGPTLTPMTQ